MKRCRNLSETELKITYTQKNCQISYLKIFMYSYVIKLDSASVQNLLFLCSSLPLIFWPRKYLCCKQPQFKKLILILF